MALDLALDDDLIRRGLVRDVIRQVQELRKSTGLELADRIDLTLANLDELSDDDLALVATEVLAVSVTRGTGPGDGHELALEDRSPATAWLAKS